MKMKSLEKMSDEELDEVCDKLSNNRLTEFAPLISELWWERLRRILRKDIKDEELTNENEL